MLGISRMDCYVFPKTVKSLKGDRESLIITYMWMMYNVQLRNILVPVKTELLLIRPPRSNMRQVLYDLRSVL